MKIDNQKTLDVINYHSFGISLKVKDTSYWIEAMRDGVPTRVPLTKDEIKFANTVSEAFKGGYLFFDEEYQKEIYEDLLRIPNWENILTPAKIRDILCSPSIDGLQILLNVRNVAAFEIIRGIFVNIKNVDDEGVTTRVENIINERYKELQNKIYNTNIMLRPKDTVVAVSNEDVKDLKSQNENLQAEMAQMREMMQQLMADKAITNVDDSGEDGGKADIEKPKSTAAGRPRKS